MLVFSRRNTRGLAMSSLLLTTLVLGVACGPNAGQENSPEVSAPETPGEQTAVASPTEAGEVLAPVGPDANTEPAPANQPETVTRPSQGTTTTTATTQALTGLRSVADWETLFLGVWNRDHTGFLAMSNSLDSWQFYGLAYGIDGNTAMYRATGKTQYIDRALLYVNNMVAHAKVSSSLSGSQFKDSYLGWASARSDTLGQEVPLFESYCWRYVTNLLRVIHDTPALYGNATYKAQYDRLLAFTERNMFEKWYKRGPNAYIYRVNTHMASHWAYIAMDLVRLTTDATRRATYQLVLDNINLHLPNYNASLRQQMGTSPVNSAAYFWSESWGSHSRPGQDVSHGNGVMAFVVEARDVGMGWTATDISKFVATLNSVVWPSSGVYRNYVDGTGTGNGWFNDGFVKLGRYDANLQRRLEAHTVGRNTQFFGNGALNARFLINGPVP